MERFQVKVTDMNWERIHLYFTIKINTKIPLSSEVKFFLINEKWEVESLLNVVNKIENKYIIELNIVNNGVNRCITNGTYKILAVDKAILGKEETKNNISGERYGIAVLEGSNKLLEEKGRCFRYLGTHGAYTVTFMLNEDEENVELLILCYNTNKKSLGHMIRGG